MSKNSLLFKILLFVCQITDFIFYRNTDKSVPIFLYHSISDKQSRLSVDLKVFEKQMKYLSSRAYQSISPLDLKNIETNKSFVITFDDGFRDNLKIATPVLKRYNFQATVFISTKYIGSKSEYATKKSDKEFDIMSEDEIKELESKKWLVANHFYSHNNLIDLSDDEIVEEIDKSQKILDRIVKNKTGLDIYSYPRNKYNQKIKDLIRKKGAMMAFAGERRFFSSSDDVYFLPRIEIDRDVSFDKFKLYLSPSYFFIRNKILKR